MAHGKILSIPRVQPQHHLKLLVRRVMYIALQVVGINVKDVPMGARVRVKEHVLTVVTQSAQLVRDAPIRVVVVAQIVVAQLVLVSAQDAVRDVRIVWDAHHHVEAPAFNHVPIIQEPVRAVAKIAMPQLWQKRKVTQTPVVPQIPLEVQTQEL